MCIQDLELGCWGLREVLGVKKGGGGEGAWVVKGSVGGVGGVLGAEGKY